MKRNKSILYTTMLAVLLSLVGVSCSTTARLGEGEVLYTGVKKLNYKENNTKIDGDVQDQILRQSMWRPTIRSIRHTTAHRSQSGFGCITTGIPMLRA